MLKTLKSFDLRDKRVLIRVDFNVPVEKDLVVDDFRIRAALPTIQYCLNEGAKVILISHLGRPNGIVKEELSLMPAGEKLADLLEMPIKFSNDCISEDAHDVTLGLAQERSIYLRIYVFILKKIKMIKISQLTWRSMDKCLLMMLLVPHIVHMLLM